MLDEVEASGDADAYVARLLGRGERIMGFGHRVYRAEDPRARVLRRTAQELGSPRVEVAEELERAALAALREKSPDRVLETNVEFWAAVVLEIAEIPPAMYPAMFGCARVAGWSAHIVEQRRTGPADPALGALRRCARRTRRRTRDARRGSGAGRRARRARATSASSRRSARPWDEEVEAAARSQDFRERAVAYRAIAPVPLPAEDRAAAPRPRGREPGLPRLGADLARAALARPPGRGQRRPAAAARDRQPATATTPSGAWRSCRCATARRQRDTIAILSALADDDEAGTRAARRRPRRSRRRSGARPARRGSRSALAPRVRVGGEVGLAPAPVGDVRVELGRAQVGVAEHLLDAAQVGAALEQVGREGVAQQVRVDAAGLEPGRCRRAGGGSGRRPSA